MPHTNPWFLITGDEITRISTSLQRIRDHMPEQDLNAIEGTLDLLHYVRERRP